MRLSRIRLAGFKSFVETTPVPFPGGITAIVGPNGCGKSNIIDAVRWVMGESSAKHLRGGSMADVIFSGSSARKPVGQASIELVFDNSDATLGGQYAGFAEIAVRRQVNRDGQSAYYLNGTRCRRRDITDVFLGTGLGPRSYSIIEQGTISRLIEAKPEELRGYLEEAAGISLYKERRRETERRMRDTRDNLERLEDVRDEVGRQLEKLSQQAQTAERYRTLKAQARERQAELLILRVRELDAERQALRSTLNERDNALEAKVAEQRRVERDIEALRAQHAEGSDALNAIQGRYYQIGSDIARVEQRITHRRELRETSGRELSRNREELSQAQSALQADQDKAAVLTERIDTLTPELSAADTRLSESSDAVVAAQSGYDQALSERDRSARERADAEHTAELERARIEELEDRQIEQKRRHEKLSAELASLVDADSERSEALATERQRLERDVAEAHHQLEDLAAQLQSAREERTRAQAAVDQARQALLDAQARQTSLQTLQEAALGSESEVSRWLETLGIEPGQRLGEQLSVEPGWEGAVEAVLGDALQAIASSATDTAAAQAHTLGHGRIMLYRERSASARPSAQAPAPTLLQDKVKGPALINDLLAFVHVADDEAAAQSLLAELPAGHSVVTPEGRWWGHEWLRLRAMEDDAQAGVLARARELDALAAQITAEHSSLERAQEQLAKADAQAQALDAQRSKALDARSELERELAGVMARIDAEASQRQAQAERQQALEAERDDLSEAMEQGIASVRAARDRLQTALDQAASADTQHGKQVETCEQRKAALVDAREAEQTARDQRQDIALRLESAQTAQQSLDQAITRLQAQIEQLEARNTELLAALDEVSDSDERLEQERQDGLEQRVRVEAELSEARERLEHTDQQLRELAEQRSAAETAVSELRAAAESSRHRDYEIEARIATQREQLQGLEVDAQALDDGLDEAASQTEWEREIEKLDQRIRRLGPINLAAIDEHKHLAERKTYLDEQQADLAEALETLQTAIQQIDRETRTRFRETFDKVNTGLQRLFPRLFGGGQAYLEMTDDDLLETGVTIMARPPGKRISNIHLLSGGEKALAAVSLVFAIFDLNPAPFCMLDEVDAPLDEANVGRFCDLLKEMSQRVQFIVITHNKATMEAASHLTGVTMAEPGVSRLVAVDVAAAVEMASAEA
jgi:chromosome segregation protein